MKTALLFAAAILVSVVAPNAPAEKYPSRPMRLIVPFPPGGGTDIMSRAIAGPVSESLGQTVVVDNRPGAGGAVGAEIVARAEPDGYTLVMVSSSYTANAAYRISMVPTLPHVRAGRLRAIGITTPQRSSLLPDVPAIGETVPGFEVVHWYGIWGPKGLPKDIVGRWNKEVAKVLLTDEMKRQTRAEGLEPGGGPPAQLGEIIRSAVERWGRVVKEAKIEREG